MIIIFKLIPSVVNVIHILDAIPNSVRSVVSGFLSRRGEICIATVFMMLNRHQTHLQLRDLFRRYICRAQRTS